MTILNPRNAACQHVIVVDNDPAICDGLSMLIASEGMTCSIFADGISFLDQMPQEPPLFVLLDIDMPGMSGLDVLKELKSNSRLLKVIKNLLSLLLVLIPFSVLHSWFLLLKANLWMNLQLLTIRQK